MNTFISLNSTLHIDNTSSNITQILIKKINDFQNIVKKTILAVQRYKTNDIIGTNEYNTCTQALENIFNSLKTIL